MRERDLGLIRAGVNGVNRAGIWKRLNKLNLVAQACVPKGVSKLGVVTCGERC